MYLIGADKLSLLHKNSDLREYTKNKQHTQLIILVCMFAIEFCSRAAVEESIAEEDFSFQMTFPVHTIVTT